MDVFRGLVEDFAGRDTVAPGLARLRHLEHVGHELRDPLRRLGLPVRPVALLRNAVRLKRHHCREPDQQH